MRLEHILIAAREVAQFVAGKARPDLDRERILVRAITHATLEIGEAAANLSEETRGRLGVIPWDDIVRMRNFLVHVYWGVDLDKLWITATVDIPRLEQQPMSAIQGWPLDLGS